MICGPALVQCVVRAMGMLTPPAQESRWPNLFRTAAVMTATARERYVHRMICKGVTICSDEKRNKKNHRVFCSFFDSTKVLEAHGVAQFVMLKGV